MSKKSRSKAKKKFLLKMLIFFRLLIDYIIDFIFKWIYQGSKKENLSPIKKLLLSLSAVSLAKKIRTKEVSSEEVVIAFIERIKEVNPILNAVVGDRYESAIQDAKDVDKFLASTNLSESEILSQKPFLGVPFTSKESTAAEGMAFTIGLVKRKNMKASEDAEIVARVKKSGAILLAVSNVPELNLWCETRNNVYGQTLNPYDITKTVGGSSGGESSIIAACGSPMGIGTDIGGSTRMPAYFCGIFGHKPTTGLISTRGMGFRTGNEGDTMVTAGTMSRFAEDITPFLKVLLADSAIKLRLDSKVNCEELNFFYITEPGDKRVSPVSKEVKDIIIKAANHLASAAKKEAQKAEVLGFNYSFSLWRHGMSNEPGSFPYYLGNCEEEVSLFTELPKTLIGKSNHTFPAIMRLIDLKILPPTNAKWAENETNKLRKDLLKLLGDNGVLLFPNHPTDAPYHYASFFRPYNFAYWAIFNVLKFPVTQVPMGLSKKGLPLGIQVVAGPNNDRLCIAVAKELERAFGGWVPPYSC